MMPPVSLPLNGGTVWARAAALTSIPQTATRLTAPIIRIADSISLRSILKVIARHGKNGRRLDTDLSAGVAAVHLTLSGLRGTVCFLFHPADCSHARPLHLPAKTPSRRRARRPVRPAGIRSAGPGGQSAGTEFRAVRPEL